MSELEKVTIVCAGRYPSQLWQHLWADVSAWNEDWTRAEFHRAMLGLVKAGYLVMNRWLPIVDLTAGKGREVFESLESDIALTVPVSGKARLA